jgi:hypothetical protein
LLWPALRPQTEPQHVSPPVPQDSSLHDSATGSNPSPLTLGLRSRAQAPARIPSAFCDFPSRWPWTLGPSSSPAEWSLQLGPLLKSQPVDFAPWPLPKALAH